MALTFSEMTQLILAETYRDPSFTTAVQNAIVSAIKELETSQLFLNTAFAQLTIYQGEDKTPLPEDFISVLETQLLSTGFSQENGTYNPRIIATAANGFREMTFWELKTYENLAGIFNNNAGTPYGWALWGNDFYITPRAPAAPPPFPAPLVAAYYVNLFYYRRDGYYPTAETPNATSIWLGDFTQDVTRYTARGIFYRDSLQSPELAQSDFNKAQDALSKLYARNAQRETINVLSM